MLHLNIFVQGIADLKVQLGRVIIEENKRGVGIQLLPLNVFSSV